MSTIAAWFSKGLIVLTLAVVATASLMPTAAFAISPADIGTPAAPTYTYDRLQQAWAREQAVYERLGRFFGNIDSRLARAQRLLDRAKANGKDVSALQAALDAFIAAVKQARPTYESINGIVASHQGFDAAGNVVDPVKALGTVLDMHAKLKEIRQAVVPAAKALRQAIRDFRAANQSAATPVP